MIETTRVFGIREDSYRYRSMRMYKITMLKDQREKVCFCLVALLYMSADAVAPVMISTNSPVMTDWRVRL